MKRVHLHSHEGWILASNRIECAATLHALVGSEVHIIQSFVGGMAPVPTLVPSNNTRPTGLDLPFLAEGTGWSTNRSRS